MRLFKGTKECIELMKCFESFVNSTVGIRAYRFDKDKSDSKYDFYESGETNERFRCFMAGYNSSRILNEILDKEI